MRSPVVMSMAHIHTERILFFKRNA